MTGGARRFSTLGRPLDPSWGTNRAVMILVPLGAALAWSVAALRPGIEAGWGTPISGAGAVLGGWALGRELAPDRQAAAFVAMALAWTVAVLEPTASLLLLFATLLLTRVVNRTVGLPATPLDAVGALGLTLWASLDLGNPLVTVAAVLAFAGDAVLPGGPRRHLGVAVVASGFVAWGLTSGMVWATPSGWAGLAAAVVAVAAMGTMLRTRELNSVADHTGELLDARRVRTGIAVALVVGLATLPLGDPGLRAGALVWAVLAGVSLR